MASYLTLVIAFATLLYFSYLAFWPVKAIDIFVQPYNVLTPVVQAGDNVKYEIEYCRYTDVDSVVTHHLLIRDELIRIPSIDTRMSISDGLRLREGCAEAVKTVHIPEWVDPGEYVLQEVVSYQVNFLQNVAYTFKTEPFTVTQ